MTARLSDSKAKANVARALRTLLDENGLSISEVARRAGERNHVRVLKLTKAAVLCHAAALSRIAAVFGLTADDLLHGRTKARQRA